MFVVIGTTHKGETFVIGHTTSRKKAEAVAKNVDRNEYMYAEVQTSHNL